MKYYSLINLRKGNIMATKKEKRMKKCPFCWGKASIATSCRSYRVLCSACGATTKWFKTNDPVSDLKSFLCGDENPASALAIAAWNKRRSK